MKLQLHTRPVFLSNHQFNLSVITTKDEVMEFMVYWDSLMVILGHHYVKILLAKMLISFVTIYMYFVFL